MAKENVSLFLSPEEMQLVWNCMLEQPGKVTYTVVRKMHQQFIEQGILPDDRLSVAPPQVIMPIPDEA